MSSSFRTGNKKRSSSQQSKLSLVKRRPNSVTPTNRDDGMESFGIFESMLDNYDHVSSSRRTQSKTKSRPITKKSTGTKTRLEIFNSDNRNRKRLSNASKIEGDSDISKMLEGALASSQKGTLKRQTSIPKSQKRLKRNDPSTSQVGIQSFFGKSNDVSLTAHGQNQKVEEEKNIRAHPVNVELVRRQCITNATTRTNSSKKQSTLPSILSRAPPMKQSSLCEKIDKCHQPVHEISSDPIEEVSDTEVDQESIIMAKKEKERRAVNKQVFGRRFGYFNILAQLERRSTSASIFDRYIDGGYHGMRSNALQKWQILQNIQLDMGRNMDAEITSMEFDSEGVLLAIALDDGYIRIFDFDEVNAINIDIKRRELPQGGRRIVAPFICFRVGSDRRISSLNWNPFNENMIGVTFFNKRETRIYDVSNIVNNSPIYLTLADTTLLDTGTTYLKFLSPIRVIIGGNDGTVSLWKLIKPSRNNSRNTITKPIWNCNPFGQCPGTCGEITDAILLKSSSKFPSQSGQILFATSFGNFAVVDINRCERKAFSSQVSPTIMRYWNLSQMKKVKKHVLPTGKWMGVRKMYLWSAIPIGTNTSDLSIEIGIVTNGAWLISIKFDIRSNKISPPSSSVIHRSPKVVQCNADRSSIHEGFTSPASVPDFPSVFGAFEKDSSLVIVTKTKTRYQVLPDYDKRVLSQSIGITGLINSTTDGPEELVVIHRNSGPLFDIPVQGKLKRVALHPKNEWMVASYSAKGCLKVDLMTLRSRRER